MDLQTKQTFIMDFQSFNCDAYRKRTVRGKNYVAFINSTRDMEGLITSLKDELSGSADVEQVWIDSGEHFSNAINSKVRKTALYEQKPIIANSCVHVLLVSSEDSKILDYTKFLINRYMNAYTSILQYDDKPLKKRCRPKPRKEENKSEEKKVKETTVEVAVKEEKHQSFGKKVLIHMLKYVLKLLK